jgi:hypothetical protein
MIRVSAKASGLDGTKLLSKTVPCWYDTMGIVFPPVSGMAASPEATVGWLSSSGTTDRYVTR